MPHLLHRATGTRMPDSSWRAMRTTVTRAMPSDLATLDRLALWLRRRIASASIASANL